MMIALCPNGWEVKDSGRGLRGGGARPGEVAVFQTHAGSGFLAPYGARPVDLKNKK
jgi:hypothetical protein